MANEAVLVTNMGHPITMKCADGLAIEKGALLRLSGSNSVLTVTAANQYIAGIAAAEKVASDGVDNIAVFKTGRFKMMLSGSCSQGDPLASDSSVNYVKSVLGTASLSGSVILGRAMEAGTTGQSILVELGIVPQGS